MANWRSLTSVVIVVITFSPFVRADIMPMSETDGQNSIALNASFCRTVLQKPDSLRPFNYPVTADLDLWSIKFSLDNNADISHTPDIQPSITLSEGPSSLNLCLSALLSLGLCNSFHWIRKIHLGSIPEWYHNGGPLQIGHSHALCPITLCPIPVNCFIQPVRPVGYSLPQYCLKATIPLWRESQFTPTVLASRPPPFMS
jgi:hypothetical protein